MDIDDFLDRELSDIEMPASPKSGIDPVQPKRPVEATPILDDIKDSLSKGKLDEAEKTYMQIWNLIVQKNFKWDKAMYDQLSNLSRQLLATLNKSMQDIGTKSEQVNDLFSRARIALSEGKKENALKIYSDVQAIVSSIPNAFFEEKKMMQDKVFSFYHELKLANEAELINKVISMIKEVSLGIDKTMLFFQRGDVQSATLEYIRITRLYSQMPEGFLKYRNPIGMRLLEIYKSISIYNEMQSLQSHLGDTKIPMQNPFAADMKNQAKKAQIEKLKQELRQKMASPQPPVSIPSTVPSLESENSIKKSNPSKENPQIAIITEAKQSQKIIQSPPQAPQQNQSKVDVREIISSARRNFDRGLFREAAKDIDEALRISPYNIEAKTLRAKIIAWQ